MVPDGDHVASVQLATSPDLGLTIDADRAVFEQDPGIGPRIDDIGQLEELTQADHVITDGYVLHAPIMSAVWAERCASAALWTYASARCLVLPSLRWLVSFETRIPDPAIDDHAPTPTRPPGVKAFSCIGHRAS
jgi:hypothetical protein